MAENKYLDEHGLATLVDQVRIFRGTKQQWDLLSTAQKKLYSGAELTEDTLSGNFDVYSMSEVKTNKVWIDGKPIYRKVIDCGALPNNDVKLVQTDIIDLDTLIKLYGFCTGASNYLPIPFVRPLYSEYEIGVYYTKTTQQVSLLTGSDRTSYQGYVILEYTKTTD